MKTYPLYPHKRFETLRELTDICSDLYGDRPAYSWQKAKKNYQRSFSQVRRDVRCLCWKLSSYGSMTGHIAILGENSYEWIIAYEAVVYGGQVIVPLDKDMPLKEVLEKLTISESDILLLSDTYRDYAEKVREKGIQIILFSEVNQLLEEESAPENMDELLTPIGKDTLASIVFTSGTTGVAKGVKLTHGNFATDVYGSCCNVLLEGSGILLLPLHHTFGLVASVLSTAFYGQNVYINRSLRNIASDLKTAAPQQMFVVPLIVEALYKNIWAAVKKSGKERELKALIRVSNTLLKVGIDLRRTFFSQVIAGLGGKLELIVSGGAPISEKLIYGFEELGITVLNGYGITECSPVVAVNRNKMNIIGSVGLPLPCNEIRIAEDGEVLVRGGNVMQGYYHNEAETKACLKDGWFYTGDLGKIDEYGALHITGRKKNLIILSNGENVSAEELEQQILDHIPFVKEVVVSGSESGIEAECYLDPEKPEGKEKIDSAIKELNHALVSSKRIQRVIIRETEFPKTTTKKIIRGGHKDA